MEIHLCGSGARGNIVNDDPPRFKYITQVSRCDEVLLLIIQGNHCSFLLFENQPCHSMNQIIIIAA